MTTKRKYILYILGIILLIAVSPLLADGKDGNKDFLNWLFEEEGEKAATSKEDFDTFEDSNENGIDDRMEKKSKVEKKESTILEALKSAASTERRSRTILMEDAPSGGASIQSMKAAPAPEASAPPVGKSDVLRDQKNEEPDTSKEKRKK